MEKKPAYGPDELKVYLTLMPIRTVIILESNVKLAVYDPETDTLDAESAALLQALDEIPGIERVSVRDPYQLALTITEGLVPEAIRVAVKATVQHFCLAPI
jgi:hypothetical protein